MEPNPETFYDFKECNKDEGAPNCDDSEEEHIRRCKACIMSDDDKIICKPDVVDNCKHEPVKIGFQFNGHCLTKEDDTTDCYKQ